MIQVTIKVEGGLISIRGPYSESNNRIWRELGGKFRAGFWNLPDNDTAREAVADLFGSKSDETEVLVPQELLQDGQIVQLGGYVLAQRRGQDCRVQMPEGVALETGTFYDSGGSVKHPRVRLDPDVVFRLRCRKSFAEARDLRPAPGVTPSGIEI